MRKSVVMIEDEQSVGLTKNMMRVLGLKKGDCVEVKYDTLGLTLENASERCVVCGSKDDLEMMGHAHMCAPCRKAIYKAVTK